MSFLRNLKPLKKWKRRSPGTQNTVDDASHTYTVIDDSSQTETEIVTSPQTGRSETSFPLSLPPRPPRTKPRLRKIRGRFDLVSFRNPGFCPGAFTFRAYTRNGLLIHRSCSSQMNDWRRCLYCGLEIYQCYPLSYTRDWPEYAEYSVEFGYESHIATTSVEHRDLRSCLICWEYKRIFIKPMTVEEWGKHMKKHLKEDGYQICTAVGKTLMQRNCDCHARGCLKVHS